jgi:hypothetical protein
MQQNHVWSRRKFSKAVISAQLLLASGVLSLSVSCETKGKLNPLKKSQRAILRIAMDDIIPESDKMPPASEIGGLDYISEILIELPDIKALFESLLQKIEANSMQRFDSHFVKLNTDKRTQLLQEFEKTENELFNVLKNFVYESYYLNPLIWERIGYESYPTGSAGPTMEPFDNALLARMQTLSPSYKKI